MKLKTGQKLKGNPLQADAEKGIFNQPPGIGKTIHPVKPLKTIWEYKRFWEKQIAKTSKNIHS